MGMGVNLAQLDEEIRVGLGLSARLGLSGGADGVVVHWQNREIRPTKAQLEVVADVVAAHVGDADWVDPSLEPVEVAFLEAGRAMRAMPGWATWTAAEVADYIESEVVDLASAKRVLIAMGRAIVYLRDHARMGPDASKRRPIEAWVGGGKDD